MEVLKLENGKLVSKQLKKEEYYSVTINFYDREDTILKAESLWDLFLVWQKFKDEAGINNNERTWGICY